MLRTQAARREELVDAAGEAVCGQYLQYSVGKCVEMVDSDREVLSMPALPCVQLCMPAMRATLKGVSRNCGYWVYSGGHAQGQQCACLQIQIWSS